jgi:hypothetical protein
MSAGQLEVDLASGEKQMNERGAGRESVHDGS